jgi:hypothetical protein
MDAVMSPSDAAALLGVSPEATPDEVRRRYESLHNDFRVRLTNAPTPALKKTYQKSLVDLQAALEVLAPGGMPLSLDLPTVDPAPVTSASPAPRPAARPAARSTAPGDGLAAARLPRAMVIAVLVAAVMAGACAWLVITRGDVLREARASQVARAQLQATHDAMVATYGALPWAPPFRVRNDSERPIRITSLALTYVNEATGAVGTVHSGNHGYPEWTVRPGATVRLDGELGRAREWNGPVLFYSFIVEYQGVEPFLKAGVASRDVDTVDKAVVVDMD